MNMIIVTAKITAGVHPKHGAIVEGRTYVIDEADFAPQLFHRPEETAPEPPPEPNTAPAKEAKAGEKTRRN